ncbi:MAG: peptidoglycan-binding protein [Acidobacteriia bacterium]|nr:peptidoglycan-binding protein [Terriglobia bacterium]
MPSQLSQGSSGTDVSELQAGLNFHMRRPTIPLVPDGIFGPKTEARLREFQAKAKISVDGIAGERTFGKLYQVADGVTEVNLRRRVTSIASPNFSPGLISQQFGPTNPDFIPPSQRFPQARTVSSEAFEFESKFTFSPLEKDQPFKLTFSKKLVWPVFLPAPLQLDIDKGMTNDGKFTLDAKLKLPFRLIETNRLEIKPYFFVGAGMKQDGFSDLNTGAAANLRLKLFDFNQRLSLAVEADGGVKYNYDVKEAKGGFKGILEGGVILEGRF